MTAPTPPAETQPAETPPWGTPLFPQRYVWLVLLSALDVLMTTVILTVGGREANPLADWVLGNFGLRGMTIFKFVLISGVILLIEYLGRRDRAAGKRLCFYALVLTMFPVVVALVSLALV